MTRKNRWQYWLPTLLWAGVIFWFSSLPAIPTSTVYWQDFVVKKLAHLFEYSVLAFLLYRSLVYTTKLKGTSLLLVTFCLVVLYAITDETHQSFTPGREPRVRDVLIDSFSAATTLWLVSKKAKRPLHR